MKDHRPAIAAALCLVLVTWARTGSSDDLIAEVRSDRLQVDHARRQAVFEGHVKATYGRLTISCSRMQVTYDDKGNVTALKAEGQVTVTREAARATAGLARLDVKQGLLVLENEPVLFQGAHRLTGSRIAIHIASGKIDVSQAKGRFELKLEEK
jgi:lipopolysaccharide transport protein LptA